MWTVVRIQFISSGKQPIWGCLRAGLWVEGTVASAEFTTVSCYEVLHEGPDRGGFSVQEKRAFGNDTYDRTVGSGPGWGPLADFCEHVNEHAESIKVC